MSYSVRLEKTETLPRGFETMPIPEYFRGTIEDFYNSHIEQALPSASAVEYVHELILTHLFHTNGPLIVRAFGKHQRRGHQFTCSDSERKFICSDNEAALWLYMQTKTELINQVESIGYYINTQCFPIRFSTDRVRNEQRADWLTWRKKPREIAFSDFGWLHAHLCDAARGFDNALTNEKTLITKCFRYLHPANHFPIMSGKKYENLTGGPTDFGADIAIKSYIELRFRERYHNIWPDFGEFSNGERLPAADPNYILHYKIRQRARAAA